MNKIRQLKKKNVSISLLMIFSLQKRKQKKNKRLPKKLLIKRPKRRLKKK
jgi:hypothetical protein